MRYLFVSFQVITISAVICKEVVLAIRIYLDVAQRLSASTILMLSKLVHLVLGQAVFVVLFRSWKYTNRFLKAYRSDSCQLKRMISVIARYVVYVDLQPEA